MDIRVNEIGEGLFEKVRNAGNDIHFSIDSTGGDLDEALKIYDYIRANGIDATATVDGYCMSAATIILLACKRENRTATPHAVFLIHSPSINCNCNVTKTTAKQITDGITDGEKQLKEIYASRTDIGDMADTFMDEEREFNAETAKNLGFVNSIFSLKNNKKSMFKIKNVFAHLQNQKAETKNGDTIHFDMLEMGSVCDATDGVYKLQDGTVITVENGKISDVILPQEEPAKAEPAKEDECGKKKVKDEVAEGGELSQDTINAIAQAVVDLLKEDAPKGEEPAKEPAKVVEDSAEELLNKMGGRAKVVASLQAKAKVLEVADKQPKKKMTLQEIMDFCAKKELKK